MFGKLKWPIAIDIMTFILEQPTITLEFNFKNVKLPPLGGQGDDSQIYSADQELADFIVDDDNNNNYSNANGAPNLSSPYVMPSYLIT